MSPGAEKPKRSTPTTFTQSEVPSSEEVICTEYPRVELEVLPARFPQAYAFVVLPGSFPLVLVLGQMKSTGKKQTVVRVRTVWIDSKDDRH